MEDRQEKGLFWDVLDFLEISLWVNFSEHLSQIHLTISGSSLCLSICLSSFLSGCLSPPLCRITGPVFTLRLCGAGCSP